MFQAFAGAPQMRTAPFARAWGCRPVCAHERLRRISVTTEIELLHAESTIRGRAYLGHRKHVVIPVVVVGKLASLFQIHRSALTKVSLLEARGVRALVSRGCAVCLLGCAV